MTSYQAGRPQATRADAVGLRSLAVFLDHHSPAFESTLTLAGALAGEHGARLTCYFVQSLLEVMGPATFAEGAGIGHVIDAAVRAQRADEAAHRTACENVAASAGLRAEWHSIPPLIGAADAAALARYSDMAIVARHSSRDESDGPSGLVQSLVLRSGRPVIVVPPGCTRERMRRIVIAWNESPAATRAVTAALPILARAAAVQVVVVSAGRSGTLREQAAADIEGYLLRRGIHADVLQISAGGGDVGGVLLNHGVAVGADLIVLGAFGHSRLRERMLGSVTRHVLKAASLPLLLSR
jgi:nucleotide-binding universal stress UspA family protein